MKKFLRIAAGLALAAFALLAPAADAATVNCAMAGCDVVVVPLHISGQYTATTVAVARFTLPFEANVLGVSASARASGGTSPTLTVDVKEAAVTILSAPITVTAGAVAEGTVTDILLADEAAITIDFTIGGTSPTWNDIIVLLTLARR